MLRKSTDTKYSPNELENKAKLVPRQTQLSQGILVCQGDLDETIPDSGTRYRSFHRPPPVSDTSSFVKCQNFGRICPSRGSFTFWVAEKL